MGQRFTYERLAAKRLKIILVVRPSLSWAVVWSLLLVPHLHGGEGVGGPTAGSDRSVDGQAARIPGLERDVIKLRENVEDYVKILPNDREVNELVHSHSRLRCPRGVKVSKVKSKKDKPAPTKPSSG